MARTIEKLSALFVSKQKEPGYYGDGAGLYLQISKSGSKSWIFKYTLNDRPREMGLGAVHTISLTEAREEAKAQRKLLREYRDPIEERAVLKQSRMLAAAKSISFDACAEKYLEAHRHEWKNDKSTEQWANSMATYAGPIIGSLSVADVDVGLVLRCLEPIWLTKTKTATRVRGRIEKVLDWATVRGYRKGENPARWKGHLEHSLAAPRKIAKVEHHPALPYAQVSAFVKSLRDMAGLSPLALEFTILTAGRAGQTLGATWDEFDLKAGIWTIPGARMKMDRDHRVPLSGRVLEMLEGIERQGDFVFYGNKGKQLSEGAMLKVLDRMGRRDITVHGFRSTFKDWASETTAYPKDVSEMALAHAIGNKVEEAYRRGDLFEKRRRLMDDWARYCETLPKSHRGEVVEIRRNA